MVIEGRMPGKRPLGRPRSGSMLDTLVLEDGKLYESIKRVLSYEEDNVKTATAHG